MIRRWVFSLHSGNRLTTLSLGSTDYTYKYDHNGNLAKDGPNNISLIYNFHNLLEKVKRGESTLANYSYREDNTKLSATNTTGNGLYYFGSLVYKKQGNLFALESAGFFDGRIVATSMGFKPHYFLTDHLENTRVVVNSTGMFRNAATTLCSGFDGKITSS